MKFFQLAGFLLLSALLSQNVAAQISLATTDSLAATRAARQYYAATQAESNLLNGVAYVNVLPGYYKGSPFFLSALPQRGTIEHGGNFYAQVPLLYEEAQGHVVLFDSARNANIQLFDDEIRAFSLGSHQFVRLRVDSASAAAGFYEVLAAGPAQLLAGRRKRPVKSTNANEVTGEFVPDYHYFVQHQGRITEVTKLSQVLDALPDQRPALQKLARSQRLKFKNESRETSLTALVRYYNELSGSK